MERWNDESTSAPHYHVYSAMRAAQRGRAAQRRRRGMVGREVYAWAMRVTASSSIRTHLIRGLLVLGFLFLILICFRSAQSPLWSYSSTPLREPPCLDKKFSPSRFCTGTCNSECFPRVQNICFSADKVRICEDAPLKQPLQGRKQRQDLPKFMRFFGEKLTVPVEQHSSCSKGWHWISGLSLVADQRFLRKPNPHHEAEKLIPAILLKQFDPTAALQWFAAEADVSIWAKGLLEVFHLSDKVRYHTLPTRTDDSICFEDAVLFSGPTHLKYIPNKETNSWLRTEVLNYCDVQPLNSSWPVSRAVVLDRAYGPRKLANKLAIGELISRVLEVPVEHRESGIGGFCDQVRKVVEDDFFLVPHGSQNVNFLFARPGTVVIEVFPYLFHTDAFRNFTHAADVDHHSLLGIRPPDNLLLWVYSFLGWDSCYNRVRWCKNYARKQALHVDFEELKRLLQFIQSQRSAFRAELGW